MQIHVYNKNSGQYISSLSGDIDMLMLNIQDHQDYTLTAPPPDYDHEWRWIDSKWTTDDTAS